MTERQYKKLYKEYQEEFSDLGKILKDADSITGERYKEYPYEARKLAITLVERWFKEAFAIENEQPIPYATFGDDPFLRIKAESEQSDK